MSYSGWLPISLAAAWAGRPRPPVPRTQMTPDEPPHPPDPDGNWSDWDLPNGRHFLPRDVVTRHQRARLIDAVATVVAERGYQQLTVAHVATAAGVSRSTFYENFEDKQAAVLAAYSTIFRRYLGLVTRSCDSEEEWPLKVKAAIGTTIDYAVVEPAAVRLLTIDAIASGVDVAHAVLESADQLAELLRAGRKYGPLGSGLPELTEKALVGAISAILSSRLVKEEPRHLHALEPQLVELTLMPYVGVEEASRVAASE
jgi:AcrR family transcriptional regulator